MVELDDPKYFIYVHTYSLYHIRTYIDPINHSDVKELVHYEIQSK